MRQTPATRNPRLPGRAARERRTRSAVPLPGHRSGFVDPEAGAVAVEYAFCMLLAAAILLGVESGIFRPMAVEIFKDFMSFIAKPYP